MQRHNPSGFFSFISKAIFLFLLGEALVYLIGVVVILPVMVIGFLVCYIWMRIETRHTWKLEQERYKIWREIGELETELRSPSRKQDIFKLCRRIDELKAEADGLTAEIQRIQAEVAEKKSKGE